MWSQREVVAIEVVRSYNWVDILVIILGIRIVYIAYKKGFVVELFKSIGVVITVFLSLHYYVKISDAISSATVLPPEVADIIVLLGLTFFILLFKFIRDGFLTLIKIEPKSVIDKWCAVLFGIFRAGFLISLILVIIFSLPTQYMRSSIKSSYFGSNLVYLSPNFYKFCFDRIVSKLSPKEEFNEFLFEELNK